MWAAISVLNRDSYKHIPVPTRLVSGWLTDQKGPAWVVIPGLITAALAILFLPLISHPTAAYLVPLLFGLGMGSASPALTTWMLKTAPPGECAVAVNTFTIMTEGSGFFSTWLVGAFLQSSSLRGFLWLTLLLGAGLRGFFLSGGTVKNQVVLRKG